MGNWFENAADWLNETFFDTDNLEFDTDNLRNQASSIKSAADELRQAQATLTGSIEGLRDTWRTGAGKEFFAKYDTDWNSQLSAYFDMLDVLVEDLQFAAEKYESIRV